MQAGTEQHSWQAARRRSLFTGEEACMHLLVRLSVTVSGGTLIFGIFASANCQPGSPVLGSVLLSRPSLSLHPSGLPAGP